MSPDDVRLYSGASAAIVRQDLAPLVNFQGDGMALEAVEQLVADRLLPHLMRYDSPGFQSMFNSVPEAGAAWGAQVALAHNQGVTNWQVSPGGAVLEDMVGLRLCRLFSLSPDADATFMYSGTYANQQALYMALHRKAEAEGFNFAECGIAGFGDPTRLVVLASKDAHFSLNQSARMLGMGERSLVPLDLNANRQIDPALLRQKLAGLGGSAEVVGIVATAGTTSTGAIDPIEPLVEVANDHGAWLHVDGAYGFSFSLLPELAERFRGVEKVDSITWDPHKQLAIPIPNSVLFVNDRNQFSRMAIHSGYFNREASAEPNPGVKSAPSTRPMSALPLATSLLHQGLDALRDRLRVPRERVATLREYLGQQDDFSCCHTPDTGILCFRYQPSHVAEHQWNALQTFVYDTILAGGTRSISVTQLDDTVVLRILVMNAGVSDRHLLATIDDIRACGARFAPQEES